MLVFRGFWRVFLFMSAGKFAVCVLIGLVSLDFDLKVLILCGSLDN